jgi:WhiB family transcriptional regulator, redox-sensing transcriptional regulator
VDEATGMSRWGTLQTTLSGTPETRVAEADAREQWRVLAACRDGALDFFSDDLAVQRACIAVCRRCPVARECLRYAVETREAEGIWAGEVFSRRRLRTLALRRFEN